MQIEEAREFALSLPGVTEAPHFEKSSFRIGGRIFATVPVGSEYLHVFVGEEEIRAAVAESPDAFEELWWGPRMVGVRIRLPAAEPHIVRELLQDAHNAKMPKPRSR